MKFRMIKDAERQGINFVSRNFSCGCLGCNNNL